MWRFVFVTMVLQPTTMGGAKEQISCNILSCYFNIPLLTHFTSQTSQDVHFVDVVIHFSLLKQWYCFLIERKTVKNR